MECGGEGHTEEGHETSEVGWGVGGSYRPDSGLVMRSQVCRSKLYSLGDL